MGTGKGVAGPRRRQSWFGVKRHVKRLLSLRIPHAALRAIVTLVPSLRSGRLPAPARLTEVVGQVDGGTFVMLRPDRCENAKDLYWGRGRRTRPEDDLALHVAARLVRGSDVLLDIGAYTGLFTMAATAVEPRVHAHAFDIVPGVVDALRANVARNGVGERVTVHLEGVGDPATSMRVPSGEGGSALPSFYSRRMTFDEGEPITFRSLDSIAELVRPGARVVMKIDVEGTENDVFASGQEFLRTFRPDALCELLAGIAEPSALEELLRPLAYRTYLVRERDLLAMPRLEPDRRFRDWLFTVRAPAELEALGLPITDSGQPPDTLR